jgi:hypothetical protein
VAVWLKRQLGFKLFPPVRPVMKISPAGASRGVLALSRPVAEESPSRIENTSHAGQDNELGYDTVIMR